MPRRFRLGRHRKNEFRKKSGCTLVVEHVPLTQDSIVVESGAAVMIETVAEAIVQDPVSVQQPSPHEAMAQDLLSVQEPAESLVLCFIVAKGRLSRVFRPVEEKCYELKGI